MRPERISLLILFFLLAIQFSIFSAPPWPMRPKSDERYFVSEASSIGNTQQYRWRPAGYATYLACCSRIVGSWETARLPCGLIQFLLMTLVLVLFHWIACQALPRSYWLCVIAVVLGIQPWCFEDSRTMIPDSLTASLTTIGIIGLFVYIRRSQKTVDFSLLLFSTLLCVTAWLRAEMIVIVPVLITAAVLLKRLAKPVPSRELIYFCFISFVLLMAAIVVRTHFVRNLSLSPGSVPVRGAWYWTKTWFSTEKTAYNNFLHDKKFLNADVRDFPDYTFADDSERNEIARAFHLMKTRKTYDLEVDRIFRDVADKRSKENFLINRIFTKIWRTLQLWLYVDSNNRLLLVSGSSETVFALFVVTGLYILKISIYLLAGYSFYQVVRNLLSGALLWHHQLTAMMLVCVIARTLLMGTVLDWTIHRYALVAWPAMLWCAISGMLDLVLQKNLNSASARTLQRA
jgi:hypothetical protein